MSSISRVVRAIRCGWPTGRGGAPGRVTSIRSVDQLRLELGGVEPLGARLEQRLELLAGACWRRRRPGPVPPAAARRSRAGSRSARLCGRGSGPAAPPARRELPAPSIAAPASALISSIRSSIGLGLLHGERRYPLGGDRRRRGDVERVGTARAQGDRHPRARRRRAPPRAAPRARRRGRRWRRRRACRVPRPRGRRKRHAARAWPRPRPAAAAERRSSPCWRAPPSGENGSAQSGPRTTGAAEQRVGGAHDRPDVARVADAVQVEQGANAVVPGSGTTASGRCDRPDGDHPRAGAERRDVGEQLGLDLLALEARARPRRARTAARPRPPAPPRAGPRPRSRTGPRARGACARAACGPASASRFVGFRSSDSYAVLAVLSSVRRFYLLERKSGPSFTARPGERNVGVAARRPHPPGLAPQIGGRRRGRGRRSRPASCGSPRPRLCSGRASVPSSSCPRAARRR